MPACGQWYTAAKQLSEIKVQENKCKPKRLKMCLVNSHGLTMISTNITSNPTSCLGQNLYKIFVINLLSHLVYFFSKILPILL